MAAQQLVSVYRKEHFNAAHRLFNASWNNEKNKTVFGKCSNEHYHGHNYELVVKLTGPVDVATGFVFDLKEMSDIITDRILEDFDHKNLNLEVEEFKTVNPTAENIAIVIFNRLRPLFPQHLQLQIRLYETERNFVDYPA